MDEVRSRELKSKQLADLITEVFDELRNYDVVLSAPDGDKGIFKYIGTSPQAQFHLSKMSKKRDVKRTGLGFVIQRAELPDRFRISIDLEISDEVIGKDTEKLVEAMSVFAQYEYGIQSPDFIIYTQPAHSGMRGWENKTFIGIEIDIVDRDFNALKKLKKKILNQTRKLFQSLDHALTQN